MRSTRVSARGVSARRLPLAFAAFAFFFALGSLPVSTTAETMPTQNTMDDAADMLSAFARYEMEASTIDLVDAETGAPLSARSKAALADSSPFDDAGDFDLGLFVDARDGGFEPGQTVNVTVCDFGAPENCVKAEPYEGAPAEYECGASDERLKETDFRCVAIAAVADDDGDLSLVEMDVEPVDAARYLAACPGSEEDDDDEDDDESSLVVTDADETSSEDGDSEDDSEEGSRKKKKSRRLLDSRSPARSPANRGADWRRRGKPRCAAAPDGPRGPSARAARAASPEAERAEAGPGGGGDGLEGVSNASGSRQTNEARTETTDLISCRPRARFLEGKDTTGFSDSFRRPSTHAP